MVRFFHLVKKICLFWFGCLLTFSAYSQTPIPGHAGSIVNGEGGALLPEPNSVYVSGNYAYVVSGNALEIVDVSNPAAPMHIGSITDGTGGALLSSPHSVYVSMNYAYVASSHSNALEIVNVSNPAAPVHTGSITDGTGGALLNNPLSVYVSGNYAYVASSTSNALEIVDVSNPAAPVHKGSITDGTGGAAISTPHSVYVSGNFAYVASSNTHSNALEIVDVSNPAAPVHKGSITNGTGGALLSVPISIYVSGDYAYVASFSSNALEIVDVSNPAAPVHKGSITNGTGSALLNEPTSVYVSGNYAYVASGGSNALEIVDVSNPAVPVHKGSLINGTGGALIDEPSSVYVSGNYAYVASSGSYALEIMDVSNPATPAHEGSITNGTGGALLNEAYSVCVSGTYAYVASAGSNALEIVDVSNPGAPVHKGSITDGIGGTLLASPYSVYVSGNYAYVASGGSNALEIVDVSNPGAPVHKGSITDGTGGAQLSGPYSICVSGNYAYVASNGSSALEIVDVTNPTTPVHKGSLTDGTGGALLSGPKSVYVSGNYAYIASGSSNALEIVDVSNPAAPVHKGSITNGTGGAQLGYPYSVYVSGNYAYIASNISNALEIVDVSNPATPVHKGSITNGSGGALLVGPFSVYVSGNYAYVSSANSSSLEIVDVSNPAAPLHKGSIANGTGGALLGDPVSVYISGNYAYVASSGSNALEIISIFTPVPPVATSVSLIGQTSFQANWNSVGSASDYSIDVSTDIDFTTFAKQIPSTGNVSSYPMTGLNNSTTYYFRIRASNANGASGYSNPLSFQTAPLALAELITGLAPSPLQAGITSKAFLGFSLTSDGPQTMSSITFPISSNPSGILGNFKLVKSSDNSFTTTGDNTTVGTGVSSASQVQFSGLSESISGTINYFLVADVSGTVTASTASIQTSLAAANISLTTGGVSGTTIVGTNYSFVASQMSDVVASGGTTSSVAYINFQTASGLSVSNSVSLATFQVRDGGGTTDADNLPTILNAVTLQFSNPSNLRTVALYDGTNYFDEQSASSSVTFSGLVLSAADNSTKNFTLLATFQSIVTDDQYIQVSVTAVTASSTGSGCAQTNGGGAATSATSNQIAVTATKIVFTTPPSAMQVQNANVTPAPVAQTLDGLNNLDIDYNATATVSNSASLTMTNLPPSNFAAGMLVFPSSFQFTSFGVTTLTVASGSLTSAVSNSFTVLASQPTTQSTNINFPSASVTSSSITINFTPGSGTSHLVVIKESATVDAVLLDGTNYPFNPVYKTAGTELGTGTGNYVVASGAGTSVNVTNLNFNKQYNFQVFDFNGSGVTSNYLTTNASGNPASQSTLQIGGGNPLVISATPAFTTPLTFGFASSTVSVNVSGGTSPYQVTMYYRDITAMDSSSIAATDKGSGLFEVTVDSTMMDHLGMEFHLVATDNAGATEQSPSTGGNSVIYRSYPNSTTIPLAATSSYQMFSVPYTISAGNSSIGDVFSALGAYDKTKWRVFHYQDRVYEEYQNGLSPGTIDNGKGYWLITNEQDKSITSGAGEVVHPNQGNPDYFSLPLEAGQWNQIGNPFPFSVNWSLVQAANPAGTVNKLWTFDGSSTNAGYSAQNRFDSWKGGFLWSDNATSVIIPVTAKCNGCRTAITDPSPDLDQSNWQLPIQLSLNGLKEVSGIGMNPEAKISKDRFDQITIPRFIDYLELNTYHPEYAAPYFATDVVPTSESSSWTFTAMSNQSGGQALLSWDQTSIAHATSALALIDLQQGALIDMKQTGQYSFSWSDGRQFKIVYNQNGEILPGVTLLGSAFPNPFTANINIPVLLDENQSAMQINVYDMTGRKVKTISLGDSKAGAYQVLWDGSTDEGLAAASGLYLYQLRGDKGILATAKRMIKE